MIPKLPHPKFYGTFARQCDPCEVMDNFYELAKCATSLGYENFKVGTGFALAKFERQRSIFTIHFSLAVYASYPATMVLMWMPVAAHLLSVSVGGGSVPADSGAPALFSAVVSHNSTALGTVSAPTGVEKNYVARAFPARSIAAGETLRMSGVTGSVRHLTFEFTTSLITPTADV